MIVYYNMIFMFFACESARSLNSCPDESLGTKGRLDHLFRHERVQDGFGALLGEGHGALCLFEALKGTMLNALN